MKKALALLCACVMIFACAAAVAAEISPSGQDVFAISFTSNASGSTKVGRLAYEIAEDGSIVIKNDDIVLRHKWNDDGSLTLYSSDSDFEFLCWEITGNYKIVSGKLTDKEITIKLFPSDLSIVEKFDTENGGGNNDEPVSPPTGDTASYAALAVLAAGALCVAIKAKKSF